MTGLFIRFYLGVLAVLFLAWYINGRVLERRTEAEWARVVVAAHRGGALLVASHLDGAPTEKRQAKLEELRQRFDYPLEILPVSALPASLQRQISQGGEVFFDAPDEDRNTSAVVVPLTTRQEVVRLGPFPSYRLREIEESLGGWMRLTAATVESAPPADREAVLDQLAEEFAFPIALLPSAEDLPERSRERIRAGEDVVFYSVAGEDSFAAIPFQQEDEVVVFGPFPRFDETEHKAATTTLAIVLLPAAAAIALLLRPVARQLRYVERTAKAIASGDLSARVDERRVSSTRSLAQSFNHMAARTESLVRTQRELLQAVSHELRTPLARMRFAVDLISTAQNDIERQQRLRSLDDATEELDALVGELLAYVRSETTEVVLNRESIALNESLHQLTDRFGSLYPSIRFEVSGLTSDTDGLWADPVSFQRAMSNLLSNACRFAKENVRIRAQTTEENVTIDVDDDGGGIPVADRQRVFEPFVRLNSSADADARGVGLGLALVKRVVTQHGGSVVALNSPLGGCCIRTIWPNASPKTAR